MAVVCRAVVNLRSDPGTESELVTQELLGRSVQKLDVKGDWALCRLSDGYRGWLPLSALRPDAYAATHIVISRFGEVRLTGRTAILAPLGSLLEVRGRTGRARRVVLPDGRRGMINSASVRRLDKLPWPQSRLDYLARQVIGSPYLWGGKSTFGFDCSGLVQTVFEFVGRRLPRDSKDQALVGRRISKVGSLRIYDLVFFQTGRTIDHVAIHLGGLRIMHASGGVVVESLDASSPVFRRDLLAAFSHGRRLIHV